MSTARTIHRARDLYAAHPNHTPAHIATTPPGTYCIVTALLEAVGVLGCLGYDPESAEEQEFETARDALDRLVDGTLSEYNADHTTAEVVGLFDLAATLEGAREQDHAVSVSAPAELVAA